MQLFNPISFIVGLVFAPIAAAMAFLITYGEYSRHYTDKKKPLKFALEAALLAFVVFSLIAFIAVFVVKNQ